MSLLYLLSYDDSPTRGERALAVAEGAALARAQWLDDHLLHASREADVTHAAYVSAAIRLLASAHTQSELIEKVCMARIQTDRFWIESKKIPGSLPVPCNDMRRELGAHVEGKADSRNATDKFMLVATRSCLWFGRRVSSSENRWRRFRRKPYSYVRALPARIARAMVHLVAKPGDRIVDPCCGSGAILIEAADIGLDVQGFDIAPRMVEIANANLSHFGFRPLARPRDVRDLSGRWNAVITDLPYGHIGNYADANADELIPPLTKLAPRGAVVLSEDRSSAFEAQGVRVREVIPCPCSHRLVRYVHVFVD